jgi:hypothetical protein
MSTPDKEVISGRVPADTFERFEEYREQRDISKSDAVRRLVVTGLDAVDEDQQQERKDARTQTGAEEWCSQKAQSWAGVAILSASGFTFLFLIFLANYFGFTVVADWPISLAMFAFLFSFVVFGGGALATWTALRTGFARRFAQRNGQLDEQGAGN